MNLGNIIDTHSNWKPTKIYWCLKALPWVLVSQNVFSSRAIYAVSSGYRLMRDSTSVLAITDDAQYLEVDSAGNTAKIGTMNNIAYLDSPATTSATTYKTQGRAGTTAQSGQVIFQRGDLPSSMVLLEIGA